jgi:hypothetical protein
MNESMKWILFFVLLAVALVAINKLFKTGSAVTDTVADTATSFGLGQSDDAKAIKTMKAFKPSYYKTLKGNVMLTTKATALKMAKDIYDAVTLGGLYSDDGKIIGVFKNLKTKSQVSWLANVFFEKYGTDMLTYFYSPMTDSNLKTLYNIVNDLPTQSV